MTRDNLKQARKAKGMTQQATADYLRLTERQYKYIESGHTTGKVDMWDKLEDLFNVHQRLLRETSNSNHVQADNR